jgi:hypothetical protein
LQAPQPAAAAAALLSSSLSGRAPEEGRKEETRRERDPPPRPRPRPLHSGRRPPPLRRLASPRFASLGAGQAPVPVPVPVASPSIPPSSPALRSERAGASQFRASPSLGGVCSRVQAGRQAGRQSSLTLPIPSVRLRRGGGSLARIEMGACVSKVTCCCRKPHNGVTNESTDAGGSSCPSPPAAAAAFLPRTRRFGACYLLLLATTSIY